jgi:hypothetical protein
LQLEVEAFWPVATGERAREYRLELFFFIPPDFRVGPDSFSPKDFYAELFVETNYGLAEFSAQELLSPTAERSPFTRMRRRLTTDLTGGTFPEHAWLHELRALGCFFRAQVRSSARSLFERLSAFIPSIPDSAVVAQPLRRLRFGEAEEPTKRSMEATGNEGADSWESLLSDAATFCAESAEVLAAFRDLRATAERKVPKTITQAFAWVDEFMSLQAEFGALLLLRGLSHAAGFSGDLPQRTDMARIAEKAAALARAEYDYRKKNGWSSLPKESNAAKRRNELFYVRKRMLRRWVESIASLRDERREETSRRWALQLASSMAAAAAMASAVTIAYLTDTLSGVNFTLTSILVIALAYVLKDRMKEVLRGWLSDHLAGWLPDHRTDLYDPLSKDLIGVCRDAATYVRAAAVPREVAALRAQCADDGLERTALERERVFKYERSVHLRPDVIFSQHRRFPTLTDTWLLNLRPFIHRLGEPEKPIMSLVEDLTGAGLRELPTTNVNVLNLVLRWTRRGDGDAHGGVGRCRIFLNRDGIARVEAASANVGDEDDGKVSA